MDLTISADLASSIPTLRGAALASLQPLAAKKPACNRYAAMKFSRLSQTDEQ
jgi:hypothetical protein